VVPYCRCVAQVVAVGGFFQRARDVDDLRQWYADALGVEIDADNGAALPDQVAGAGLAFGVFAPQGTYLGDPLHQAAMVNFVVDDLDEVLERLVADGAPTEPIRAESYGRFS
jgi:catechol 2,3-dioxygenase-like lactoylglutathione lyase family enzyme